MAASYRSTQELVMVEPVRMASATPVSIGSDEIMSQPLAEQFPTPETIEGKEWSRTLSPALSSFLPLAPTSDALLEDLGVVYEYKIIECTDAPAVESVASLESAERANPSPVRCTVTALVRASHPTHRGLIVQPEHYLEDLTRYSGANFITKTRTRTESRFANDILYTFVNVRYKCALCAPTKSTSTRSSTYVRKTSFPGMTGRAPRKTTNCPATMKISHWAPQSGVPPADGRPAACGHCRRRGHRETSCCEAVGNCRITVAWDHNHPVRDATTEGARRISKPKEDLDIAQGILASNDPLSDTVTMDDALLCARLGLTPLMKIALKDPVTLKNASELIQQLFPRSSFNRDTPSAEWNAHMVSLAEQIRSSGIMPPPVKTKRKYKRRKTEENQLYLESHHPREDDGQSKLSST